MKKQIIPAGTTAAVLAAASLMTAACGSTKTRTVTHMQTQTVTHVVKTRPKVIHRVRTVTVSQAPAPAPAPTQTTPAQTTPTQTLPFTNAHPCGVPAQTGCDPKASTPGPNGLPVGCEIVTPAMAQVTSGKCAGMTVGAECC